MWLSSGTKSVDCGDAFGRMWRVVVWALVMALFVYQSSLNLGVYLSAPTVLMVSVQPSPSFRLPMLSVCPHPAFDPTKLRDLGLNLSGNHEQFGRNYHSLLGVPHDLPASDLWGKAAWDFGQVLMGMQTSGRMVVFKASDAMPSAWRRSFSPMGPCLTYTPSVGDTEAPIYFQTQPRVKPCRFPNADGELQEYRGFHGDCKKVEEACNSSCGLESYIFHGLARFEKLLLYIHKTPASHRPPEKEDILVYSRYLFDGSYDLHELGFYQSLLVTSQLTEFKLLKGSCNSDPAYSHGQCYRQLHETEARRKLGCSLMYPSNFHEPSGKICRSSESLAKAFSLESMSEIHCPQRCVKQSWSHNIQIYSSNGPSVTLQAKTTDIKREEEVETYPLSKLFSDTGGSLGLFLGMALLTCLEPAASHLMRLCKAYDQKQMQHTVQVLRLYFILLLCVIAAAHVLEMALMYLRQPRLTAVSLRVATSGPTTEAALITRRLAARALNCRPQETRNEECRARCLLDLAAGEVTSVAAFTNLAGLPLCHDAGISLPSLLYVVPPEMLLAATQEEKIIACRRECGFENTNSTSISRRVMVINETHYNFDFLQLVCSIGGVIGLYFGCSMFGAMEVGGSIQLIQNHLLPKVILKIKLVLQVVAVGVCVLVCLWQLHMFLLQHTVASSTSKMWRNNHTEPLAITVCRWPPLSLDHLARELGLSVSSNWLYQLPQHQLLPELLWMLDQLPGNWSVTLDQLWDIAAWNLTDVIEGFMAVLKDGKYFTVLCATSLLCAEAWRPVITPLNRCFVFNASVNGTAVTELTLVLPQVIEKEGVIDRQPHLYFAITPVGETPLLDEMVAKTPTQRATATHHQATYHRLGTKRITPKGKYRPCVHRCLSKAVSSILNCRLPHTHWPPALPMCTQQQYAAIPRYFKGLEGIGRDWSDLERRKTVSGTGRKDVYGGKKAVFGEGRNISAEGRNNISREGKINMSGEGREDIPREDKDEGVSSGVMEVLDECYRACLHLQHTFSTVTVNRAVEVYPTVVLELGQEEEVEVAEEDLQTASRLLCDVGGIAGVTTGFSILYCLKDLLPHLFTCRKL